MPNVINANGLQTATQAELLAYYTAAYKSIYGNDISLDTSTPDGQWMNIIIQSVLDVQNLLVQIYNMFDPDNAIGVILDQRVSINGIEREGGTYTITNVTLVVSQSINLPGLDQSAEPAYTVSDNAGNKWFLISSQTGVAAGTHVYAFRAENPGAVLTIPNTITTPITIVLGVTSVNNPTTYSVLGINEESDQALKIRRRQSVSLSSQGYLQGLIGALENINGLGSVFVYENNTDSTDGDGVPSHTIWVIVSGTPDVSLAPAWDATVTYPYGQLASSGSVNYISWKNNNLNNAVSDGAFWGVYDPVAQAIYSKRNAGAGMFGDTSYTLTQIDGTSFIVFYDTVSAQNLFIKFTASSLDGIHPPDLSAIRAQLPTIYVPDVNAEVNINQLATLVQEIDSNTLVLNSGFSASAGGSYTNTFNPSTKKNQLVVASDKIIILPMIMSASGITYTIVSGLVTQTNLTINSGGSTAQFTGLGGYGTLTYSLLSGAGSIDSLGLYTSAGAGTDVVKVVDSLSNQAICSITVSA